MGRNQALLRTNVIIVVVLSWALSLLSVTLALILFFQHFRSLCSIQSSDSGKPRSLMLRF